MSYELDALREGVQAALGDRAWFAQVDPEILEDALYDIQGYHPDDLGAAVKMAVGEFIRSDGPEELYGPYPELPEGWSWGEDPYSDGVSAHPLEENTRAICTRPCPQLGENVVLYVEFPYQTTDYGIWPKNVEDRIFCEFRGSVKGPRDPKQRWFVGIRAVEELAARVIAHLRG